MNHRELEARRTRTKEQPSLINNRSVSILLNGQKGFGVEADQLTRMKSQKTGSVSKDSKRRAHRLTPRFSPLPGVLDLCNGERIVGVKQEEGYLVGECQDIIVVVEELQGSCVVLGEGVTREVATRS